MNIKATNFKLELDRKVKSLSTPELMTFYESVKMDNREHSKLSCLAAKIELNNRAKRMLFV